MPNNLSHTATRSLPLAEIRAGSQGQRMYEGYPKGKAGSPEDRQHSQHCNKESKSRAGAALRDRN